jgi:hypothetical protein
MLATDSTTLSPMVPPTPEDRRQWGHTALRHRMLYGLWTEDLFSRIERSMGCKRADILGDPDLSANLFSSSMASIAALYDVAPKVTGDTAEELSLALDGAALWAQMQRNQRDTLGMREMLVRVDTHVADPKRPDPEATITYDPVPLHHATVRPLTKHPERPGVVWHAKQRIDQTKKLVWTWDHWDITGEGVHQVWDAQRKKDISDQHGLPAGGARGDAYPDRNTDGSPFLRYVMYHAARTGKLLDSFQGLELVEGSLNVGVLWTFFTHTVRHASWPQRYVVGLEPAASTTGTLETVRKALAAGPTFVLELIRRAGFDGQPIIGQWAPSSDPQTLALAIGQYERRLAAFAGMNPADIQRTSGDPRSGYALAINREGRRDAQRRFGPVFKPSDVLLLSTSAKMLNRARGNTALSTSGYGVEYQALPPTAEERKEETTRVTGLVNASLISREEGRAMLGIVTVEEEDPRPKRLIGELTTVLSIVVAASAGKIPPASAIAQMQTMFGISEPDARAMLAGAGSTFKAVDE